MTKEQYLKRERAFDSKRRAGLKPERKKLWGAAIFVFSIAIIPLAFVHEAGHTLACGGEYRIGFNNLGAFTVCLVEPENPTLYFLAGGLLGAGVASIPIGLAHWISNKGIVIAFAALAIGELVKAVLEGLAIQIYTLPNMGFVVLAIQAGMIIILGKLYLRQLKS